MLHARRWIAALIGLALLSGCARTGASPTASAPVSSAPEQPSAPARTLNIAMRVEPGSVSARPLAELGIKVKVVARLFNAGLDFNDDKGSTQPYLAEAVPQLNTESWQVFPDGTMQTSYHLKPNLTWHDGAPLTADDFVLAWKVYTTPAITAATTPPFGLMDQVTAPDARTVVIHWNRIWPDAGAMQDGQGSVTNFPPLPSQVLAGPYQEAQASGRWDDFAAHTYWKQNFLGAGPYRIDAWTPGAAIEGSAFDGHVLGRPKIARVRVTFVSDADTALANLLSGNIDFAGDAGIAFQQSMEAKRQWAQNGGGYVLLTTDQWRATYTQFRPDMVSPRALADVRVRRALAHAIDKPALNEALYESEGIMADSPVAPSTDAFPFVDRAVRKYPYDLGQTDRLMNEVGFQKGPDGVYASLGEGRLTIQLRINQSPQYEKERSIEASMFRSAGFDVEERVLSAAQAQDGQQRATFPGLYSWSTGQGAYALMSLASNQAPRAETRWTGSNRGGWSNAAFDTALDAYNTTLAKDERTAHLAEMARIVSDEVAAISLYYDLGAVAGVSALRGPGPAAPNTSGLVGWNVYDWSFQ